MNFKKALLVIAIILFTAGIFNFKLIHYGLSQLCGQLKIVYRAVPVGEAIRDSSLSDESKQKLLWVEEIKKFAFDSIGLKHSKNYSTFYNQHGNPLLWVVTACPHFEMKPYEWKFPLLGKVSYKGFFDRQQAMAEAQRLRSLSYETEVSTVSGWSTLGWFTDPVLSNMLRRPAGMLAETIIHELTHNTIYLKSSVDLNENLATFIGEKGAEQFLKMKFGNDSRELKDYQQAREDEKRYGAFMLQASGRLDSLYQQFALNSRSSNEKFKMKFDTIAAIFKEANRLPLHRPEIYFFNFAKDHLPGNPYFMSFLRYRKSQDDFEKKFTEKCDGDLKKFVRLFATER